MTKELELEAVAQVVTMIKVTGMVAVLLVDDAVMVVVVVVIVMLTLMNS